MNNPGTAPSASPSDREAPCGYRRPFLKWAGGKFKLLRTLLAAMPVVDRFVEPFAGSGAVYLNVPARQALVSDANPDLVSLYRHLQLEGEAYIRYCSGWFTEDANTRASYYRHRERYNLIRDSRERGALLLYLNRHAYNGLVRYNARGMFNAPFGRYRAPRFPEAEMLAFLGKTRTTPTEFSGRDFRETFAQLRPGDVVYCDPPYVPLSRTANFTAYAGQAFGPADQADLARLAEAAGQRGVHVLVSNHDTDATRCLYPTARVLRFQVRRTISCRGGQRSAVPEILAVHGPLARAVPSLS